MPKIVIDMEAGPDMAQLLAALAQAHGVNKFEVDYGNPKPRTITEKKPLLRDIVMQQFAQVQRKTGQTRRQSATDMALDALADGSPHHVRTIKTVFEARGKSGRNVDGALFTLVRDGRVNRIAPGVYQLVSAPQLAAPARMVEPKQIKRRFRGDSEAALIEALANGEPHHANELRKYLVSKGFSPNTLDSRVQKSMANGRVERVGPAMYRLIPKKAQHDKQPEAQDSA